MRYEVRLTRKAQKELSKFGTKAKDQINSAFRNMIEFYDNRNKIKPDIKMLKGKYKGILRLRVGDLRVLFKIDKENNIVTIIDIIPRKDAYKN